MAKRLQEIVTLRDFRVIRIRIWNVFIFAFVIINIIIFIITVIIVDVDRLVLAIFASVQTTTEICARHSSLPAFAMIVGTPLLHAFAFHEVDDCLTYWGSVVITGIQALSSSSHFQPEPSGDYKTGLDTMSLFHTSRWSWAWRTAWCSAACVGGKCCDLTCFCMRLKSIQSITKMLKKCVCIVSM